MLRFSSDVPPTILRQLSENIGGMSEDDRRMTEGTSEKPVGIVTTVIVITVIKDFTYH